jgi:hypothetical protein
MNAKAVAANCGGFGGIVVRRTEKLWLRGGFGREVYRITVVWAKPRLILSTPADRRDEQG